jgi:glycosyltransferase involved in cell wall biosynthesis
VFILPSLEDGFARTVAEALACGLPVIVTPNTGASDLVEEGSTGSIVPICDAGAIAAKILEWWEKIRKGRMPSVSPGLDDKLSWVRFDKNLSRAMAGIIL